MNAKKGTGSIRHYMESSDVSSEAMEMGFMSHGMLPVMPEEIVYARAYVPFQYYHNAFSHQEALMKGTLFPELYQPEWFIKPIPK